MLQISEWLPNPTGSDAKGEWVELQNTGTTSINTAGWFLKNEKGKKFLLSSETVSPGDFLLIKRPDLTLSLRNTNGGITLFDFSGTVIEAEKFLGVAPEGKSFGSPRSEAGRSGGGFSWLSPTPGELNARPASIIGIDATPYVPGPVHSEAIPIVPLIAFPILITSFLLYTVKQDEVLSHLFFDRNQGTRQDESAAFVLQEEGEAGDGFGLNR